MKHPPRKGARFRRLQRAREARTKALGRAAHILGRLIRYAALGSLIALALAFLAPFAFLLGMALLSRFAKS